MKTFEDLFNEISEKIADKNPQSRSFALSNSGVHEIGKKIIEEAGEVWIAAEYETVDQLTNEISQLIYHLQVLMVSKKISIDDLYKVL